MTAIRNEYADTAKPWPSVAQCQRFIRACAILIMRLPAVSGSREGNVKHQVGELTKQQEAARQLTGRHDYHDCEAYQQALAIGMNLCTSLPSLLQLRQMNVPPPPPKVIKAGVKSPHGGSFFANRR